MSFAKKNWNTAEAIPATELNRIETGIDNVYNQNVDIAGIKIFNNAVRIKNAEIADKGLYILSGTTKAGEIVSHANYVAIIRNLLGDTIRFQGTSGAIGLLTGTFNGVTIEGHKSRHKKGGADLMPNEPNMIVDPVAGKGDYQTITAALAAASGGDFIYVKNGTYAEAGPHTIPTSVTLMGQSRENVILQCNKINMPNYYGRIRNMTLDHNTTTVGAFVNITEHRNILDGVKILNADKESILINSTVGECQIKNCSIIYSGATAALFYPIEIINGYSNLIVNNYLSSQSQWVNAMILLGGTGNIAANNIVVGSNVNNVHGIDMTDIGNMIVGNIIRDTWYAGVVDTGSTYGLMHSNIGINSHGGFFNDGDATNIFNNNKVA